MEAALQDLNTLLDSPIPVRTIREGLLHKAIDLLAGGTANARWLKERDRSRDSADKLSRALVDLEDPRLDQVLLDTFNGDGPCWALPKGDHLITRYDWTEHRTKIVAVFEDKGQAQGELERLKAADKGQRSSFYKLQVRP